MSSIKKIKSVIQSVKSTQKITRAMKMIAFGELRQMQIKHTVSAGYIKEFWNIFNILNNSIDNNVNNNVINNNITSTYKNNNINITDNNDHNINIDTIKDVKISTKKNFQKPLYIVLTSDKGLCGNFNSALLKFLQSEFIKFDSQTNLMFSTFKNKDDINILNQECDNDKSDKIKKFDKNTVLDASSDTTSSETLNTNTQSTLDVLNENKRICHFVFCIGKKGAAILSNKSNLDVNLLNKNDNNAIRPKQFNYKAIQNIAQKIQFIINQQNFNSCYIVYNKFESMMKFCPIIEDISNLCCNFDSLYFNHTDNDNESDVKSDKSDESDESCIVDLAKIYSNNSNNSNNEVLKVRYNNTIYQYEPSHNILNQYIITKTLSIKLYSSLLNSLLSEASSRVIAMDNAVRNSEKLIESLTRQCNKTRQAKITMELAEIVSGANTIEQ